MMGENIYLGRLIIGLFGDDLPKTVKNFYHLCKGDKKNKWKRKMSFDSTPFHKNFAAWGVMGGDWATKDGNTSRSIYGDVFDDEKLGLVKPKAGTFGMFNMGDRDTNGSKFHILYVN